MANEATISNLTKFWAKVKALVSKTATSTQNGLMTATDKTKLDGITSSFLDGYKKVNLISNNSFSFAVQPGALYLIYLINSTTSAVQSALVLAVASGTPRLLFENGNGNINIRLMDGKIMIAKKTSSDNASGAVTRLPMLVTG